MGPERLPMSAAHVRSGRAVAGRRESASLSANFPSVRDRRRSLENSGTSPAPGAGGARGAPGIHLGFEVIKGVGALVMCQDNARHLDINAAWKAVQRNLGHRCLHAATKPRAWLGTVPPQALGPISERRAVLGRNALVT